MIDSNPIHQVCNYGSSASYCSCPAPEQIATGVIPLDSLPAAWWNWMWNDTNKAVNEARYAAGVLINEIDTVLQQAGVCPNCICTDQLYQAIEKIRQTIGNSVTAGAVKSSSTASEVAIDVNGIMSVNCLGNAASLTTSARTVVGAINELKSTYDCCFTDVGTAMSGKAPTAHASSATTYGVGTASDYGHLKISDEYVCCVGAAADGVAASQKAVNDLYNLIPQGSSINWTSPNCACGYVAVRYSTDLGYIPEIYACQKESSSPSSKTTSLTIGYPTVLAGDSIGVVCLRGRIVNGAGVGMSATTCITPTYMMTGISSACSHTCLCLAPRRCGQGALCNTSQNGETTSPIIITVNRACVYGGAEPAGYEQEMNYYADGFPVCFCKTLVNFGCYYVSSLCVCNNTCSDIIVKCICVGYSGSQTPSGTKSMNAFTKINAGSIACVGALAGIGVYAHGCIYSSCSVVCVICNNTSNITAVYPVTCYTTGAVGKCVQC